MNNAIEAVDVSKRFGKDIVLDHISITFESGKIHGIVGRNGSGKTVLMKCILGFLRPTAGQITVFDTRHSRCADLTRSSERELANIPSVCGSGWELRKPSWRILIY